MTMKNRSWERSLDENFVLIQNNMVYEHRSFENTDQKIIIMQKKCDSC